MEENKNLISNCTVVHYYRNKTFWKYNNYFKMRLFFSFVSVCFAILLVRHNHVLIKSLSDFYSLFVAYHSIQKINLSRQFLRN